jgi:DNA-directed RNA polymerase specialized sigma24 family protein
MSEQLIIAECEFGGNLHVVPGWKGSLDDEKLHDLLERCLRTRDELLWAEFIRRSQPVIAGVVIKTVRRWVRPTPSLVDDLVQETYLKLFANNAAALRRFVCRHEHALYGFLKVIASNVVQDHFRCFCSQKRGSGREEESIEQADAKVVSGGLIGRRVSAIAGLQHGLDRRILLRDIDAYLKSRASEPTFVRDYTIFWLYYREGMTAKAIAGVPSIGLSVKGVESTLLRLTRLVRTRFDQRSGGLRAASSRLLAHQTQPEG